MLGLKSNVKTFTPQANNPVLNKDVSQIRAVPRPLVSTGSVGVPANSIPQTDVDKDPENAPTSLPPRKIPSVFGNAIKYPISPALVTTTPIKTFWTDAQRERQQNKSKTSASDNNMSRAMKDSQTVATMVNKEFNKKAYSVQGMYRKAEEMRQSSTATSSTSGSGYYGYKPQKNSTSLAGNEEAEVSATGSKLMYIVIIAAIGVGAYIYVTKYKK